MDFKQRNYIFLLLSAILISSFSYGQLSAVADGETTTAYSSGPQDQIYIFCASPNETVASLTATYPGGLGTSMGLESAKSLKIGRAHV